MRSTAAHGAQISDNCRCVLIDCSYRVVPTLKSGKTSYYQVCRSHCLSSLLSNIQASVLRLYIIMMTGLSSRYSISSPILPIEHKP